MALPASLEREQRVEEYQREKRSKGDDRGESEQRVGRLTRLGRTKMSKDASIQEIELDDKWLSKFRVGKYFDQLPVPAGEKAGSNAQPIEPPKVGGSRNKPRRRALAKIVAACFSRGLSFVCVCVFFDPETDSCFDLCPFSSIRLG